MEDGGNNESQFGSELGGATPGIGDTSMATQKRIPRQIVFGGCVVAVSAGVVLWMRAMGMGPSITFADLPEYDRMQANAEREREFEETLAQLRQSGSPVQVPSTRIDSNPFRVESAPVEVVEDTPPPIGETEEERLARLERERIARERQAAADRERRLEGYKDEIDDLTIQSIFGGRIPMANIDGKLLRVGDQVGSFTIRAIHGRTVEFEVEGWTFERTIGKELPE